MREQLIQYVNLLFAGTPDCEDMKQEILQNTLERFDDLVSQGKTPEAAYRLAISGIGDISDILGSAAPSPAVPAPQPAAETKKRNNRKLMQAAAIGMYICCVLPLLILGNLGNGILGLCLMFVIIAAATALMVMGSDDEAEKKADQKAKAKQKPLDKALNTVALVLFFVLSFSTGAWYITWLVFPIMGAVKGIVNACTDLKEAKKE